MALKFHTITLLLLLTASLSLRPSSAATHVVGDALGWTIPPTPSTYSTWASSKIFAVGDILVFNFTTTRHDVTTVTKSAYGSCNVNSPIAVESSGPARIVLNATGEHFFLCGFPGHCNAGQKLSVTVRGSASPAPAPAPTRAGSPASSPSFSPEPSSQTQPPTASSPDTESPSDNSSPPPLTPAGAVAPPPPNGAFSVGGLKLYSAIFAVGLALVY